MTRSLLSGILLLLTVTRAQAQTAPVRIPGTKCSLPAPAGFIASKTYSGFQHEASGAFIMVNELPAPVQSVTGGFTEASMKQRGMTLLGSETTSVRGLPASIYTVSQESKGTTYIKHLLVFGQGEATTLVTAGYPKGASVNADSLKLQIRAIDCNPALSVNLLEAAAFTINTDGTDFKPVKFMSGSLIYSTDGTIPTDKPVLIVGGSLGKTAINARKEFAEQRILQLPGSETARIRGSSEIRIDGLPGYEVIADGSGKDGNAALVYEAVLFTDDGRYYLIIGQSNTLADGLLETFRSLAKTFRRK